MTKTQDRAEKTLNEKARTAFDLLSEMIRCSRGYGVFFLDIEEGVWGCWFKHDGVWRAAPGKSIEDAIRRAYKSWEVLRKESRESNPPGRSPART